MTKFKIGDRIRRTKACATLGFRAGDEMIVELLDVADWPSGKNFRTCDREVWDPACCELVAPTKRKRNRYVVRSDAKMFGNVGWLIVDTHNSAVLAKALSRAPARRIRDLLNESERES